MLQWQNDNIYIYIYIYICNEHVTLNRKKVDLPGFPKQLKVYARLGFREMEQRSVAMDIGMNAFFRRHKRQSNREGPINLESQIYQ